MASPKDKQSMAEAGEQGQQQPTSPSSPSPSPEITLNDGPTIRPETPKGKEKKRVGFASGTRLQSGDDDDDNEVGGPSQSNNVSPTDSDTGAQDYFSPRSPSPNTFLSPEAAARSPTKRDSFNREQLAAALAMILEPENLSGPASPLSRGPPRPLGNQSPSMPRPVLRKPPPLPPAPEDTGALHRSEVEAKNRADRLAYAVGTSSVPVSRRGSADASGVQSPLDQDSLLDKSQQGTNTQDFAPFDNTENLRMRRNAQHEADRLVRSHTRRKSPLFQSFTPATGRSGTSTPIEDDLEYVPRPEKYKGGILGTLLKLYGSEDKNGQAHSDAGISSTASTPAQTPNRSPLSTPPTSRPSTPQPEKRRKAPRNHSSSTLAELMESSFMIAAPGSSKELHSAVTEKLRLEKAKEKAKKANKSKKKLEEYQIKIHIAEIINRHRYLIKLCSALMMYGAPTHRLEAYMKMSARVLGIEGQFLYLPGIMIVSFDDSQTHTTEVKILRPPQGLDFGRLRDVHEIYKEVVHDRMGVDEATKLLDSVTARKDKFPIWVRILLSGIASACVAPFGFEGRYIDMPICFILGCLVGVLQLYVSPSNELYANVFEITAAVLTSCLARAFGSIRDGDLFCFSSLAQASIALILPGYMVLCASLELQSHQMISGSVRMVYALIYTLFLGYGITIGSVIYGYMDENAVSEVHCRIGETWYTQRPGPDYYVFFVLPFTLCLCFVNQAKWRQTPVQLTISVAGYLVNNYSSRFFEGNSIVSSTLGALTIGVLANLYSRTGHIQNRFLSFWETSVQPRLLRFKGKSRQKNFPSPYYDKASPVDSDDSSDPKFQNTNKQEPDLEMGGVPLTTNIKKHARKIGYGLAAAAMLPGIFVQVPGGLAASGSLLSGISTANQVVRNETLLSNGTIINGTTTTVESVDVNGTAFNVLFSVIQVAINISVGLSLSALLVYPFGKRRSGLFSF
ncbi:hypothetical protein QBC38DRAFT_533741 [Podospora fimiseda]|uniref:Threonine/serine exporter-like N-terminal domain-containing protein n=1 Tax=Podospora fimiseda TaxID=252190 RepID=A0AAN7BY53_9PEZI|nr:hypothetical protein QBC38DRAFT_533741 [Podospora fimiseda]